MINFDDYTNENKIQHNDVNDTTFASNNPIRFRKNISEINI